MRTDLEQRALDHSMEITDGCKDVEFEFIKALKEQKDIDAEKAVKVHCKLCGNKFDYCDVCSEPDKIRQLMKEDKI